MKQKTLFEERGQILVLFSVAVIGMIALLALALDGGMAFSYRRMAQNAADAGALAGARVYCMTEDVIQAQAAAKDYAVNRNKASAMSYFLVDPDKRTVTVRAKIEMTTFFATAIGHSEAAAEAEAVAGCTNPGLGQSILPIAWSCKKVLGGSDSKDCQMESITWEEYQNYVKNPPTLGKVPKEMYIIMEDKKTVTDHCEPPWGEGTLKCDQDGDGDPEFLPDGGRSWLNLNGGGGGVADLDKWIKNGYPYDITTHTWVPDQEGTANTLFQAAATRYGFPVGLPVIDDLCDKEPKTYCPGLVHAKDEVTLGPGYKGYYHISGFAAFVIYCVKGGGAPIPSYLPYSTCPGYYYGRNVASPSIFGASSKTIEGFFIKGFVPNLAGGEGGLDTGAYVLLLTK